VSKLPKQALVKFAATQLPSIVSKLTKQALVTFAAPQLPSIVSNLQIRAYPSCKTRLNHQAICSQDVNADAVSYYKQSAVAAAALGCCCDIFAVNSSAVRVFGCRCQHVFVPVLAPETV
jgi:hypothetical protein